MAEVEGFEPPTACGRRLASNELQYRSATPPISGSLPRQDSNLNTRIQSPVGYRLPHKALLVRAEGFEPPAHRRALALQATATSRIRLARMAPRAPRAGFEPAVTD